MLRDPYVEIEIQHSIYLLEIYQLSVGVLEYIYDLERTFNVEFFSAMSLLVITRHNS